MAKTMVISEPKITDQLAELDSLKAKVAEMEKKTAIVKPYQDILDRANNLVAKLKTAIINCPSLDDVDWDDTGIDLEPVKEKFRAVVDLLPPVKPVNSKQESPKEAWLAELETVLNKKATFDEWAGVNMGEGKTFKRLSGSARTAFDAYWKSLSDVDSNGTPISE